MATLNSSIGKNFKTAVNNAKVQLNKLALDDIVDMLEVNKVIASITDGTRTALLKTYDDINTDRINQYSSGWKDFESDAPIKTFEQLPDEEIEIILNESRSPYSLKPTIDDINRQATFDIDNVIINGIINGVAISIIIATVLSLYDRAFNRSKTTGFLESDGALNVGKDKSYTTLKEQGVKSEKQWLRTTSKDPRDIHLLQVGKISVNGIFTLADGVQTRAPRLTGYAKHDINCKCGIKAVFVKQQIS